MVTTTIKEFEGSRWIKLEDFMSSLEIEDRKYIQVHDWTSKQTINDLNYHYLSTCPVSELLWFIDNAIALLKEKAVKFEIPST